MDEKRRLIVFIDSGDTIIDEKTEIRKIRGGIVREAGLLPGIKEVLFQLKELGFRVCLVADGYQESFEIMFRQNGIMDDLYEAWSISDVVGNSKPEGDMFELAFRKMNLTEADKPRTIMIGNNISADILGANRFGIRSVLLRWSHRHKWEPDNEEEAPVYTIEDASDIVPLCLKLDAELCGEGN